MNCYCCGANVKSVCYCVSGVNYWLCPDCWNEVQKAIGELKEWMQEEETTDDTKA